VPWFVVALFRCGGRKDSFLVFSFNVASLIFESIGPLLTEGFLTSSISLSE